MQFVITTIGANLEAFKYKMLRSARLSILLHKITPGETKLNNYLLSKYKNNLKAISLYLLAKTKIYRDYDNNIIILFPQESDDKLAALITYGNGEFNGSNILKNAFFRK